MRACAATRATVATADDGTMEESRRAALVARAGRTPRRARARERRAARQPARRPARAPALGVRAAGLRGRADRRLPSIYLIQGHTGQLDMWRNRSAFRPNVLELVDRALRRRGLPARARRLRRRLDVVRRLAVPRLAGRRQLPHVSLRRGRAVRRRALPRRSAARRIAASPASRAAATARWSRRCCGPTSSAGSRRTRATRSSSTATCRTSARRCARCATHTTARSTRSGPTSARGPRSRRGPTSRCSTRGRWRRATRRTTTARRPAVRRRDGPPARRRLGSAGSRGIRCAWSTRHADALRGLRAIYIDAGKRDQFFLDLGAEAFRQALERDRRHRRLLRAVRRHAQRASSTATRSRCATSRSG